MRTLAMCIVLVSAAGLQSACSPDGGRSASPTTQGASRKLSIGEFQLGTSLGPHGGIAQGADKTVFSTDQTIHVAMRLRDAPTGTLVKVVWKSPGGEAIGEETKRLKPGQEHMSFSADGESLPPGTGYHVQISANGEPVTVLRFDLIHGG